MADTGLHTRQQGQSLLLGTLAATVNSVPQLVLALPSEPGEVFRATFMNEADLTGDYSNYRAIYVLRYATPGLPSTVADLMHGLFIASTGPVVDGEGAVQAYIPVQMGMAWEHALRRFGERHWVTVETYAEGAGGALTSAAVVAYIVYGLVTMIEP